MNKKTVEKYLPHAVEALMEAKIAENGQIPKSFRGQISSFGAAITMGSFKAAAAFFSVPSDNSASQVDRSKLIKAIWLLLAAEERTKNYLPEEKKAEDMSVPQICSFVLNLDDAKAKMLTEEFVDASIALKLAMNAFPLLP